MPLRGKEQIAQRVGKIVGKYSVLTAEARVPCPSTCNKNPEAYEVYDLFFFSA